MRLKRLTIHNFGPIGDAAFDLPKGLVLIEGHNHDLGTDNGAGKSSLLNAICYCLYNNVPKDVKVDSLVHRRAKGTPKMSVSLDLEAKGDELRICRQRSPNTVTLEVNGQAYVGADVDAEIVRRLGMTLEQFLFVVYRPQKSEDSFLRMNDTAKKEFLSTILNLDQYDLNLEKVKRDIGDLTRSVSLIEGEIKGVQAGSHGLTSALKMVEQEIASYETTSAQQLQELAERKTKAQAEIHECEHKLYLFDLDIQGRQEQIAKLDAKLSELQVTKQTWLQQREAANDGTAVAELEQLRAAAERKLSALREVAKMHSDLYFELAGVEHELNHSKSDEACSICGQSLPPELQAKRDAKRGKLQERAQALQARRAELQSMLDREPSIRDGLATVEQRIAVLKAAGANAYAEEIAAVEVEIANVASDRSTENQRVWQAVSDKGMYHACHKAAKRDIESIEAAVASLQGRKAQLEAQANKLRSEIDASQASLASLAAQRSTAEENILYHEAVREVFSPTGVRGYVFGHILDGINERLGHYLGTLFNGAMSFEFKAESQNSKGKTQAKIGQTLIYQGDEVEFGSLSGGEQDRLVLAVDLALSDVICGRVAAFPNLLFLDERLTAVAADAREKVMELLTELLARKDGIYVVDHSSEVKACFNSTLRLDLRGGVSTVTVS